MNKDEALQMCLEYIETDAHERKYVRHAIKAALEEKDEPVAHSVVAGALFDFMGWLTSREKRLILSSVNEASPAVEAITEFAKKRNLSLKYAEVGYWTEFLSTPPQQEAKDEPEYYGLTKDHLWMSISKEHYDRLKPEFRMACYTTPPQRKPLTDEEICPWFQENTALTNEAAMKIVRAIEAAHGITGDNNG